MAVLIMFAVSLGPLLCLSVAQFASQKQRYAASLDCSSCLQVYSPGLVVPLAVPDFSMPYNVICLTSTVLAVFTGATLNALLERPGREQRMLAEGAEARKAERRKKKLKLLLVMALFVVFGLYVDPSLQETVVEQLKAAGLLER